MNRMIIVVRVSLKHCNMTHDTLQRNDTVLETNIYIGRMGVLCGKEEIASVLIKFLQ